MASGGAEFVQEQLKDGKLSSRSVGKPKKVRNQNAVLALKAQGKTPVEVVEILGLSRTTVSRYWRSVDSADSTDSSGSGETTGSQP